MPRTGLGWSRDEHWTIASWRGVVVGGLVALGVPAFFFLLTLLLNTRVLPADQMHAPWLTILLFSGVVLGPLGLVIAGWSAGVRSAVAWVLLVIIGLPLLAAVWVVCALMFGGATGSPF